MFISMVLVDDFLFFFSLEGDSNFSRMISLVHCVELLVTNFGVLEWCNYVQK